MLHEVPYILVRHFTLYNKPKARVIVGAVVSVVLFAAACTSFSTEAPLEETDGGSPEASPAEGGASSGDAGGGGSDADAALPDGEVLPIVGTSCGSVTCLLGEGCCLGSSSTGCTKRSACKGSFVTCTAAADCGGSRACCFDGTRATCAFACPAGLRSVCANVGECAGGSCDPLSCSAMGGATTEPFRVCSGAASSTVTRDGLTCTLP